MIGPGVRGALVATAALVLAAGSACSLTTPVMLAPTSPALPESGASTVAGAAAGRAVILLSIDGLRPDAIERAGATTLLRLIGEGAYRANAQTVLPSRTLPSHTSMVTGVLPQVHGITWNEDRTRELGAVQVPTIFDHVAAAGLTSAGIFAKPKFRHLVRPTSPSYAWGPPRRTIFTAAEIAAHVEQWLRRSRPDLLFVHLPDPDVLGHAFGWLSLPYRHGVRRADAAVARVLRAADRAYGEGNYTLIVTSDHGGTGRGHGRGAAAERTIPWLAWGRGVCAGALSREVFIEDTAPTVLELLGVPVPPAMTGRSVPVSPCTK